MVPSSDKKSQHERYVERAQFEEDYECLGNEYKIEVVLYREFKYYFVCKKLSR